MLMKPPHGAPCNGCGQCCMDQLCPLATAIFGARPGPCWALERKGVGYACGLVESPNDWAPVQVLLHGRDATSKAAAILIGAGLGCDARAEGEPENRLWLALAKSRIDDAAVARAMTIWGDRMKRPNRTASDARTDDAEASPQAPVSKRVFGG